MRFLAFALFLVSATSALAAYDPQNWYQADFWSGEYPHGFSVVAKGVKVPARAVMDPAAKPFQCELPFLAVYHPWNSGRKADYRTASRIVNLTAKEEVLLGDEVGQTKAKVRKGETIQYLIYLSEGGVRVRYHGQEFDADQGIFEKSEPVSEDAFRQDEWVRIRCVKGPKAWIFLPEMSVEQKDGSTDYLPGLDGWSRGYRDQYGKVTDLTPADLKKDQ